MPGDRTHRAAADRPKNAAEPSEVADALRKGPVGALAVAGIAVALLFLGWIAFYFLLFLPRGPVG
jgi:hypothetical protein